MVIAVLKSEVACQKECLNCMDVEIYFQGGHGELRGEMRMMAINSICSQSRGKRSRYDGVRWSSHCDNVVD